MAVRPDPDTPGDEIEPLLEFIKDARGFDFTGYKRPSLTRRVEKRMAEVGVDRYEDYRDLLEARPAEFAELFNTVLINVTGFLRDRAAWDYLSQETVPAILAARQDGDPVRVWSAGCASGEEAYSLAVMFCESMGDEQYRQRVKIYATDIDEEALTAARHARYQPKVVEGAFTPQQVQRYFEADNGTLAFRKDLRRSVIFGRHDLIQDPPISRVDLLVCRNTLMYFNAETQRRILGNFHFALNPGGFLFVGRSEALVTRTNLFEVEDLRSHVFSRAGSESPRPPIPPLSPNSGSERRPSPLVDAAFDVSPLAQLVVDTDQIVVAVNRHARSLLSIGLDQLGKPFRDLEVSYRPVELRSVLGSVLSDARPATLAETEVQLAGGTSDYLEIHLQPVTGDEGRINGAILSFAQVGRYRALREELDRSRRELETAYEELQSTVEELETTNEELQSTNEELETTNEELHSTNEELETMNEELQSTNEELDTINNELRDRSAELDDVSSFLESVLSSLRFGVAVVDERLTVRVWSRQAEELWGLRSGEVVGQHFLNLDIGLPVDQLRSPLRQCLTGQAAEQRIVVSAVNRRGRTISCEVTVLPQMSAGNVIGALVLMDSDQ